MKSIDIIKKRYLKFDVNDNVSHVIGSLLNSNNRAALIFNKQKFVGVTDKHLLLKTKGNLQKLKAVKVAKSVPSLNGKEDLKEVARLLYTSNIEILPIIQKNNVIGIIRAIDIVKNLDASTKKSKVSDIMSLKPVILREKDPLSVALKFMREKKLTRIPIVDNRGDVIKIASARDILRTYILNDQSHSERKGKGGSSTSTRGFTSEKVKSAQYFVGNSSSPVITSDPNVSISNILKEMLDFDINSVVIAEKKKAIGIITIRDLLKLF